MIRKSKVARGLGNGIQFPPSMSDMVDLIMLNLEHVEPSSEALSSTKTLDFLADAIQSGGRTLVLDESRWYDNAGGASWNVVSDDDESDAAMYDLDPSTMTSSASLYAEQCESAAADSFSRLVSSGRQAAKNLPLINFDGNTEEGKKRGARNAPTAANSATVGAEGGSAKWGAELEDLRDSLASRLAWTLKGTKPRGDLAITNTLVTTSINQIAVLDESRAEAMTKLNDEYPLVYSCMARDLLSPSLASSKASASLSSRLLYESYASSLDSPSSSTYDTSIDVLSASVAHLCKIAQAQPKSGQSHLPAEPTRRFIANTAVTQLSKNMAVAPILTEAALRNFSRVVDAPEPAPEPEKGKKTSISERASQRAQKSSAEKRAKNTLLALRDVCFRRTDGDTRRRAVQMAVEIAAGGVATTSGVADTALKLVMNMLFPRSEELEDMVVAAAQGALNKSAELAIEEFDKIKEANEEMEKEMKDEDFKAYVDPLAGFSDVEKDILERVRRAVVLYLALCLHKVELFAKLLQVGVLDRADVLNKAIRKELPKFAKSAGKKHGEAETALTVAKVCGPKETPLLLALLDNLAPNNANVIPPASLVEAVIEIQRTRPIEDGDDAGSLDSRYIIPIVSSLERTELTARLPEFLRTDDTTFQAALSRMRERLDQFYNKYRDQDETLLGMSSCEQVGAAKRSDTHAR